jgi:hypothetical protein
MRGEKLVRRSLEWIGIAATLLLGGVLIFHRLDNRALWSDEAETALLAESILRVGIPKIEPNAAWLYAPSMGWINEDGIWIWTPWLDEYVAALSFSVFSPTRWSARFPFALVGWLAGGWLMYLVYRTTRSLSWAIVGGLLFFTSLPLLYHIRQCRYYSLSLGASLLLAHGFLASLQGRHRLARWEMAGSLLIQFFTLTPMAIASSVSLAAAHWVIPSHRSAYRRDCFLAILPMFLLGGGWLAWSKPAGQGGNLTLGSTLDHALHYGIWMHSFVVPALLLLVLAWPTSPKTTANALDQSPLRALRMWSLILAGTVLGMVSLIQYDAVRYLVPIIPVLYLALTTKAQLLWDRPVVGIVFALFWASSNLLSQIPPLARYPLPRLGDYWEELGRPYVGPVEEVAEYLSQQAHPGDLILTADEELSLAFETRLRFRCAIDPASAPLRSMTDLVRESIRGTIYTSTIDPSLTPRPDWILAESIGRTFGGQNRVELPDSWKDAYEEIPHTIPDGTASDSDLDPASRVLHSPSARRALRLYRLRTPRPASSPREPTVQPRP